MIEEAQKNFEIYRIANKKVREFFYAHQSLLKKAAEFPEKADLQLALANLKYFALDVSMDEEVAEANLDLAFKNLRDLLPAESSAQADASEL